MGSMLSFERMNNGREVEMKVATVEWRIVTGAIEKGKVQDGSDRSVERILLGG